MKTDYIYITLFQERNVRIRIRILPVVRGQYATRAGGYFADFRPHSDPHFTRCSIRRSACPQIRILPVAVNCNCGQAVGSGRQHPHFTADNICSISPQHDKNAACAHLFSIRFAKYLHNFFQLVGITGNEHNLLGHFCTHKPLPAKK